MLKKRSIRLMAALSSEVLSTGGETTSELRTKGRALEMTAEKITRFWGLRILSKPMSPRESFRKHREWLVTTVEEWQLVLGGREGRKYQTRHEDHHLNGTG